ASLHGTPSHASHSPDAPRAAIRLPDTLPRTAPKRSDTAHGQEPGSSPSRNTTIGARGAAWCVRVRTPRTARRKASPSPSLALLLWRAQRARVSASVTLRGNAAEGGPGLPTQARRSPVASASSPATDATRRSPPLSDRPYSDALHDLERQRVRVPTEDPRSQDPVAPDLPPQTPEPTALN